MTDDSVTRPGDEQASEDQVEKLDELDQELVDSELNDAGIPKLPKGTSADGSAPLP